MANIPTETNPIKMSLPGFTPHYTPREILELGAFDGGYFYYVQSRMGIPPKLFKNLDSVKWQNHLPTYNASELLPIGRGIYTPNYFGTKVDTRNRAKDIPMQLRMLDPMGWFQWYTRFYYGRRTAADEYRVKQWRNEVVTLFFYILNREPEFELAQEPLPGYNKITDLTQFKNYRQHLLHFGWDSTKDPADFGIFI